MCDRWGGRLHGSARSVSACTPRVLRRTLSFRSSQKSCQEAAREYPHTEIELVLTQVEQEAVAESGIIVPYKVLGGLGALSHALLSEPSA